MILNRLTPELLSPPSKNLFFSAPSCRDVGYHGGPAATGAPAAGAILREISFIAVADFARRPEDRRYRKAQHPDRP